MSEKKGKKEAKLRIVSVVQDFVPEHWMGWTKKQGKALGDVGEMGKVILQRLEDAGIEVIEMYAIRHDKDETDTWDEYESIYIKGFSSTIHGHFLAKLKDGDTLENLAKIIGVKSQYIEKPRTGRYAYDNLLSYMIHIKYADKYRYSANDVVTITGQEYMNHYLKNRERWLQSRAKVRIRKAAINKDVIENLLLDGKVTLDELYLEDKYRDTMILYGDYFKKLYDKIRSYQRSHRAAELGSWDALYEEEEIQNLEYRLSIEEEDLRQNNPDYLESEKKRLAKMKRNFKKEHPHAELA